ncbi:MAG: porin [Colwellia sp.]|nr:porin [Colwellia sp.]
MKLVKTTIALATCSALSLSAVAADVPNAEVYGRADVSFQLSDNGKGDDSYTEVKSNASRIGLKGDYNLNDDLTVVYKAEFEVDIDGDGDVWKARNQYIGLAGGFGEVLLGKNDSILKQSQGKVDLFNDLDGDIKKLWAGENRLSDTITYKSPKFSGFQLGATYKAEEKAVKDDVTGNYIDGEDAFSVAAFYGDKKLKKSKDFASVAMDSDVKSKAKGAGVEGTFDIIRGTVQGKLADVTLGLMLQNQEDVDTKEEMDGVMVSAKYKIGAKTTLKGQYQMADYKDDEDKELSGISVGVDYKLAKGAKLYAFYTTFDMDSGKDEDYLAAGIQYKF